MKKYQLGALTVSDKGLQDTKEEIVIELIDRMQKYVAEGKAAYENGDYTEEQKLNTITNLCGRFCGLAEFLQITMGIDVRRADGRAFQLHDPETLQEDFEAEEQRLRKERREALQDWVGTNGVEACRAEVEKIWNGA